MIVCSMIRRMPLGPCNTLIALRPASAGAKDDEDHANAFAITPAKERAQEGQV